MFILKKRTALTYVAPVLMFSTAGLPLFAYLPKVFLVLFLSVQSSS